MQSESAKELRSDIKLYENAIKEIQDTLNSTDFSKNIEETTAKIEKQKARIEEYKQALANLTPEESANGGAIYYNRRISEAQQKVSQLQKQVNDWGQEQNRLNENLKEYNAQLEAAKRIQNGDNLTGSFKDAAENAKKTAKETQSIGKEAEKSSSNESSIFILENLEKRVSSSSGSSTLVTTKTRQSLDIGIASIISGILSASKPSSIDACCIISRNRDFAFSVP